MSGRPPRAEPLLGLLTAVLWLSTAFAAIGLLAWALDREPVASAVGPGFGFAAAGAAAVIVWLAASLGVRGRGPWLAMTAATAGVFLAVIAVAFTVSFELAVEQASSPFVVVAAVLAAPAVALAWGLAPRDPRSRG